MLYGNCLKVLKAINFLCRNAEETSTVDICVYLHNRIQNEDFLGCIHQLEVAFVTTLITLFLQGYLR